MEEQYRRLNLGPNDEARLRRALEQELADEVSFSAESLALARRRLARAEHEREKLLEAYFAEALPLDLFKREQNRIAKEIDLAQTEINRAEATTVLMASCWRRLWASSGTPGRATPRRTRTSNACGTARLRGPSGSTLVRFRG